MDKRYNLTELSAGDLIEVDKTYFKVTNLDLKDPFQPVELTLIGSDLTLPLPAGLFVADAKHPKIFSFTTSSESWWVETELLVRYAIVDDRKSVQPTLSIEPGKCYRTRSGRKAQVISHDTITPSAMYPFKGVVFAADGIFRGHVDSWMEDGRASMGGESDEDLVSIIADNECKTDLVSIITDNE